MPKNIYGLSILEVIIQLLMMEKHEFGLVIASKQLEAKNIAKSKWLIGSKKKA